MFKLKPIKDALGLYLDTLKIDHPSCSLFGLPNDLTLQKEFQILLQTMWVFVKLKQTHNKTK